MDSANAKAPYAAERGLELNRSFDFEAFASKYGGFTVSTLKQGTPLYVQGEPSDCMFYVKTGEILVTIVSSHGKEAILEMLGPGEFCGEGCLLENRYRMATATCITDSVVVRLERASVIRAVRQDSAVAEFFLADVLTSVVQLRGNLISQLFDSSERRLARVLLLLASHEKQGRPQNTITNVDQEALAQMIGTTRSRVNYFMNKFRKLGYIDYNGTITVHPTLATVARREDRR